MKDTEQHTIQILINGKPCVSAQIAAEPQSEKEFATMLMQFAWSLHEGAVIKEAQTKPQPLDGIIIPDFRKGRLNGG